MSNKVKKKSHTSNFRGNCEGEASASKFIADSIFFNIAMIIACYDNLKYFRGKNLYICNG